MYSINSFIEYSMLKNVRVYRIQDFLKNFKLRKVFINEQNYEEITEDGWQFWRQRYKA